jgi:hypothetical protein
MSFAFDNWLTTFKKTSLPRLSCADKSDLIAALLDSCSNEEKTLLSLQLRYEIAYDFLVGLPACAATAILSYLSVSSLMQCTRVCHRWYDFITHSDQLWRQRIRRYIASQETLHPDKPYRQFLSISKWMLGLRDDGVHHASIHRPVCVEPSRSLQLEVWKCVSDRVYVRWTPFNQYGRCVLQGYQLCGRGPVRFLWEESLDHQFCLSINDTFLLMTGPQRSGLMWKDANSGSVVAHSRHRLVCPWDMDSIPLLCSQCGFVMVAKVPLQGVCVFGVGVVPVGTSPPLVREYIFVGLEQEVLAGSLVPDGQEVKELTCTMHRMFVQTWNNSFFMYQVGVTSERGVFQLYPSLCCTSLGPCVIKGPHLAHVISFNKKLIGCVCTSRLFVIDADTLSTRHIVDISTCCSIAGTPTLRCIALGEHAAVLQTSKDQGATPGKLTMFIILLTNHIVRHLHTDSRGSDVIDSCGLSEPSVTDSIVILRVQCPS